jgi:hypothetical protein
MGSRSQDPFGDAVQRLAGIAVFLIWAWLFRVLGC